MDAPLYEKVEELIDPAQEKYKSQDQKPSQEGGNVFFYDVEIELLHFLPRV